MLNPRGLLGDVLGHALPFFYGIIPVSTNKISILYFLYDVLFGIIGTTILNLCWNLMSMNKRAYTICCHFKCCTHFLWRYPVCDFCILILFVV